MLKKCYECGIWINDGGGEELDHHVVNYPVRATTEEGELVSKDAKPSVYLCQDCFDDYE